MTTVSLIRHWQNGGRLRYGTGADLAGPAGCSWGCRIGCWAKARWRWWMTLPPPHSVHCRRQSRRPIWIGAALQPLLTRSLQGAETRIRALAESCGIEGASRVFRGKQERRYEDCLDS